jgi:hypothetical protein
MIFMRKIVPFLAAIVWLGCYTLLVTTCGDLSNENNGLSGQNGGVDPVADSVSGTPSTKPAPLIESDAAPGLKTSAPFDLGAVIRQVHFAFRWEDHTYAGGHTTYGVWVDTEGRITMIPGLASPDDGEDYLGLPLNLQTTAIRRGGFTAMSPTPLVELTERHSLRVDRGASVEWLENTEEGLSQSWSFDAEPDGRGDLLINVRVNGLPFVGRTENGLHFADDETGLGLRYSDAVWIDSLGRRTAVAAEYVGDAVVMRVPGAIVSGSVYPARLDPTITPEFGLDNPVYPPLEADQNSPAVAFNGTRYLIVWHDKRLYASTGYDIYATRTDLAGGVLDPDGILISSAMNTQFYPAVTSDGADFLVVWQDSRYGSKDILGSIVTGAGVVQHPSGIAIVVAGNQQEVPDVAFDGTNYFVVWHDTRSSTFPDIYGNRVSRTGSVLDASGFVISAASGNQRYPVAAFDGVNYLVVWADTRNFAVSGEDIHGARVTTAGGVVDPASFVISNAANTQDSPDVAYGNGYYLVVWRDLRTDAGDIYAARVNTSGNVLDATGIAVTAAANEQGGPTVTAGAGIYLLGWHDFRAGNFDIYAARVTNAGSVLDPAGLVVSNAADIQELPAVAFDGENFLFVWQDRRYAAVSEYDILGAFADAGGNVYPPQGLVFSTKRPANQEQQAAVAFDGTNYLVVWRDQRFGGGIDIYGTRVDALGAVLDPAGLAISTATNEQSEPAVAFGGTQYFVAWQDKRSGVAFDIYGSRVTTDGDVLEPAGLALSTAVGDERRPAVAFAGSHFLAVWQDQRNANYDIYATQVSAAGGVVQPAGIPVTTATGAQEYPTVASDGTDYFLAWQDIRSGNYDIYAARVDSAGTVLDPAGLIICDATGAQTTPAAVYNAPDFLVVWDDARGADSDIYGGRVETDGTRLDGTGFVVCGTTGVQQFPALSYDGINGVAVWVDYRAGQADIYANWITPNGVRLLTNGAAIAAESGGKLEPAVASAGGGHSLVVYYKYDQDAVARLRARRVWWLPVSTPCTVAGDCLSGFCVDGFCCDTACGGSDPSDCQVCSMAAGAVADGICTPLPALTLCRGVAGVCDVAEYCNGADGACPTDAFEPDTLVCRGATDLCDAVEYCPGNGANCLGDALLPPTEVCRAATDLCDATEYCTGAAKACPPDGVEPDTEICRDAAGLCDLSEYCDGSTKVCPADEFEPLGTTCRDVADLCDDPELCPGDGPNCPSDAFLPDTTPCRDAADICDVTEFCPGDGPACPADAVEPDTVECRSTSGDCDVAEFCDGANVACPTDAVEPDTTECRAAAGLCDDAEFCDGSTKNCPADALKPDTAECRATAGLCDVAELCTGASVDCPPDAYEPETAECRTAAGLCDAIELCPGDGPDCPADVWFDASTECRASAGLCDVPEMCTGESVDCPADVLAAPGVTCRESVGPCDVTEACTGDATDCPADELQPATEVCRASAGDCDAVEYCTGESTACPADAMRPPTFGCRPEAGGCDLAEFCTGDAADCPTDVFMPLGAECRAVAGQCDIAETCAGGTPDCPVDEFLPATTLCRPVANECDVEEYCPGDGPACPVDEFRPDGDECDDGIFCNGLDYCLEGFCDTHLGDPCLDNIYCNGVEVCHETERGCTSEDVPECPDDGQWCNGEEFCNEEADDCDHTLTPGTRCPDDGVWCNGAEACDEEWDRCYVEEPPCPDDGAWCNGEELCDEELSVCHSTGSPCAPDEVCVEALDDCVIAEDTNDYDYDPDVDLFGCGC